MKVKVSPTTIRSKDTPIFSLRVGGVKRTTDNRVSESRSLTRSETYILTGRSSELSHCLGRSGNFETLKEETIVCLL